MGEPDKSTAKPKDALLLPENTEASEIAANAQSLPSPSATAQDTNTESGKTPSVLAEFAKRAFELFWESFSVESGGHDMIEHIATAKKKGKVLTSIILVGLIVFAVPTFLLKGCYDDSKFDSLKVTLDSAHDQIKEANADRRHFEIKAKEAENALAPWKELANSKFPYESTSNALANVLKLLTRETPNLPYIKIETLDGLPIAGLPKGQTNGQHLKLHRLGVRNYGEVEIDNFRSRLQIPEPILLTKEVNESTGTLVGWRSIQLEILTTGTSGRGPGGLWIGPASADYFLYPELAFNPYIQIPKGKDHRGQQVAFSGSGEFTGIWELTIDKLPPSSYASVLFFTSDADSMTNYIKWATTSIWKQPLSPSTDVDTNELRFYLEGEYQFQTFNKSEKQYFLVPITFDSDTRKMSSHQTQTNIGDMHPIILESY